MIKLQIQRQKIIRDMLLWASYILISVILEAHQNLKKKFLKLRLISTYIRTKEKFLILKHQEV